MPPERWSQMIFKDHAIPGNSYDLGNYPVPGKPSPVFGSWTMEVEKRRICLPKGTAVLLQGKCLLVEVGRGISAVPPLPIRALHCPPTSQE